MRELVNKYESAHGSDDTIIVSTLEPDTPKEDRGENNKVSKPFSTFKIFTSWLSSQLVKASFTLLAASPKHQ